VSLKEPAKTYGLMPNSTLAFLVVSVTRNQAQNVLFRGLSDLIRNSPYFRAYFPSHPKIRSQIRLPQNVVAYPVASTESAVLGEGVFSAAFDEMNFMPVVERSSKRPEGANMIKHRFSVIV